MVPCLNVCISLIFGHFIHLQKPVAGSDYLQVLDKTTRDIVGLIMEYQKMYGDSGGEVKVPDSSTVEFTALYFLFDC
jgi:hypothetical protein